MTKHSENTKPSNSTKPVLANRIFKLRAWVRNELMVNVVSIDFNNEFITWDDNQYDRCVPPNKCYEIETFDDIVLMQFTNFKDKKGIDIYEGDIFIYNYTLDGTQRKTKKVEFDKEVGAWYLGGDLLSTVLVEQNNDDWKKSQNYKIKENQYLIISGNIYDNPNLLQ